ncbi:MAG: nucleoside hydrolase [Anaerolineaceae bacterium]|nr:nucleoside hydrolase [Anaerolineaceae bacterium]
MTIKVLLDTDIGSDIDDAICLAYLLAHPDCELLGITTVTGEGIQRAQLASALCRLAGVEVPIYVGAQSPLLIDQRQPHAPQAAALENWPHETDFPQGQAVQFLQRTIRENPGEVVLLTIGPLTNAALLFATDPEIPALLKGMVLMGGSFWSGERDGLEWNIILDPHASAMTYRARPPYMRSIGLDVTTQVQMHAGAVRERFQSGLLRPVLDFAEVWFKQREVITFHDPLAAAVIFDEGICGFERGQVDIELDDPERLGKTHWSPGADDAYHEVATSVQADAFFEHYFGVLGGD